MICVVCGDPATRSRKYEDMCQFHWDCMAHELIIRLNGIRDQGQYGKDNRGPNFLAIYYGWLKGDKEHGEQYSGPGNSTLGYGLYIPKCPREAMEEAFRTADRNNWRLLRVDVQGGSSRSLGMQTCTDIYVSEDYSQYMTYSRLKPLPYDVKKYGALRV